MHRRGYRFIANVITDSGTARQHSRFSHEVPREKIIVGRESEIALLEAALRKVREGRPQMALISGEAGIGKSTLVDHFIDSIRTSREGVVVTGQCIQTQGPGEAYGPLFEILGALTREIGAKTLAQSMRQYAPLWLIQMPHLLTPEENERLQRQLMGTSGRRMLRELAQLIGILSQGNPIVLVLEDLHWADQTTLDAWAFLGKNPTPARLLLASTHRPAEAHNQPMKHILAEVAIKSHCKQIPLSLLTVKEIDIYLSRRFPNQTRPLELSEWLHRYTEGNPLFLNALIAHAEERGWLRTEGLLTWEEPVEDSISWSVPDNLRDLIDTQFQQLPSPAQECLETAGVVGMTFPTRILCDEPEVREMEVETLLDDLAKGRRLISYAGPLTWPDGSQSPCYTFTHAWYRQVVYDRIPLMKCQKLHRQIGGRLEQLYGKRPSQIATTLAMHFELGRDFAKAIAYRCLASEIALGRHAYGEAKTHSRQGIRLLDQIAHNEEKIHWGIKLRIPLGNALIATEGYSSKDVITVYSKAHNLCQQGPQSAELMPVLHGLATYYLNFARKSVL